MSEDRLDRIEKLVGSNAKSIEALTSAVNELRKDRKGMYELLARLTRSMADFYETQSDFYRRFDQIDERQEKIAEILRELKPDSPLTEETS